MSGLWRRHPDKKGKLQEIDMGMLEIGDNPNDTNPVTWRNKKGTRRATSSSQKYAEGWDRIFGKDK